MKDPDSGQELPHYEYAPDESPKRKHHWDNDWAGFARRDGVLVGKCPSSLSVHRAEALLNEGLPWFNPRARGPYPDRVYVVHGGVVYRATSTNAGRSYHGFPELPATLRMLPKRIKKMILERAREQDEEEQVRAYFEHDPEDE